MASALFSSIQSLSTNLLKAIRGTPSTSHQQQDPPSPVTDQQKSVIEDLEKLSRMLARIQAVQQDAEEREIHDCSVRLWLAELRGVAYQAEDLLDEFYYEVLRSIVESGDAAIEAYHRDGGAKRKFGEMYTSSSLTSKVSIPNGMAEKIKSITERFEEISNARRDLHLREEDGTRLVMGPQLRPPTSSHLDERATFGREEEKEEIISILDPSDGPDFMVLPIVGMGGFGKTTLAQLVFNDSRIHGFFNKRCWVSVSEDFDLVRLTKAIIDSLSENPCEFSELNKLQDVLKEKISGHGLFLVLDDVWNEQRNLWECFQVGFLGTKFVRILTTTRNTSVAEIMQTTSPFQLGSLPEENCWSLFKHFAFGNRETSENANLHEIGRGIVKKCKGSPLAIKALGGILRYEMDEEKWREILESDISEIDEKGEVMPALRLSYRKLPQHLKPCFLYLSMFPKDKPFEKDTVVRLWMAQGYINGNTRNLKTLEEIGSEYFDELQGRSLVDCAPFTRYLLHDLIHDLARSVSQEAYRPVLENDQEYNGPHKVCHMYFTTQDELLGLVASNYKSIRTFVKEFRSEKSDFPIFSEIACARALLLRNSSLPNTFSTLKHLRYLSVGSMKVLPKTLCLLYNLQTLVLNCHDLGELPENMKNLSNLRYFKLTSMKIQHLPESIFPLPNLQTLSLRYCTQLKELPRGIEQSTRLHILDLPRSHTNMPSGIGKLPNLQQLTGCFSVMDHGINGGLRVLKDMNKLRGFLCISGLRNIVDVELCRNANLASKPNLQELILNFQGDCVMEDIKDEELHLHLTDHSSNNAKSENDEKIHTVVLESLRPHGNLRQLAILNYQGRVFPSWLLNSLLPKLTTLFLFYCTGPNFIPPFGQLPNLRILTISGSDRNLGDEPSTYSLLVEYDSSEQPKKPSYPSLEELSLRNMLKLVEWQANDGDFPCLKKLVLENCPELLKITTMPQNVRDVTFKDCPKLKFLTCPSVIRNLKIMWCGFREIIFHSISKNLTISCCVELKSINWCYRGLNSIEQVSFEYCPKLELITIPVRALKLKIHECGFREIKIGSMPVSLTISNCLELISINVMDRDLNTPRKVSFEYCPKLELHVPVKDVLHSTDRAEIYGCPRLYLGERYVYQRDTTIKELNLSGNDVIRLSDSTIPLLENQFKLFLTKEDFREVESLTCAPSVGVSCQHVILNLASLVILEIMRCSKVISVTGLDNLSNLKYLSISFCPELCNWNDKTLPQSLEFLKLNSCDKLSSLPLLSVQNHSSTLEELVIKKCPRLDELGERYIYQRDTTIIELNLTGNNEIHLSDSTIPLLENQFKLFLTKEYFWEVESLTCAPSVGVSCQHVILNLASLVILEIMRCTKVISVTGLDNLSNLKYLSISFCPELCNWNDKTLPQSLEFLKLNSCDKLSSLPLLSVQNHSSTLEELVIKKCPRLDELGERYIYQRDTTIKELNLSGNNEIHLSDSTIPLLENQFKLFLTKEFFWEVESLTCAPSVGVSCQHVILNLASLVILEIMRCTKIISVTGLDNLSNLKHLCISDCPELCNWKDKTLPLLLESLKLSYCDKLSSLPLLSVQNHSSTLEVLVNLQHCEIYDCPRLYLGERYVYQRDTTIKEFNLSGNNEINLSDSTIPLLENQFKLFLTKEDFREVESLTCAPSVGVSCQHVILNLASLVILEIMWCTKVISVTGLDNLSNLKCLRISFCPELCNWNDKTLPLSLKFLELNYCDKLSSLPLLPVQNHSNTLEVLVITMCPRLDELVDFQGLMKLKTVDIRHCRNISISLATESLPRPHINIGDCPLMRDWCQRNNITYNELIGNPQEDREAELESAEHGGGEHESGEEEFGEQESAEIYDCPRLYLGERYVYQRDTTIKELNLSGNNIHLSDSTIPLLENQFKLFLTKEDFREVESLTCAPSVGVSCQHVILNLASLVILEIMRCTKVISVTGLDNLGNLKCLSISFCPELCNWNDKTLPLSLKFLELNHCDKLSSLPLLSVQNHSSTLEVLVMTMCPRLDELVDFQCLMKLKTVDIRHCRNISISLATESLPRPRINIGDCPLMRDWCQRNNITYNELYPPIGNPAPR